MPETIFTIGHSTHPMNHFIALLKSNGITALCDVRSKPYSRLNPQFNRENLQQALRECSIAYVFLGKELGARSEDPSCYKDGRVQYDCLAQTDLFRQGLSRIQKGVKEYRVALVCAEKDPLECHRTILVSRHLETLGLAVQHIHADGSIESHGAAMNRLVHQLGMPGNDMFRSREDILVHAYQVQAEHIAYRLNETALRTETLL